MVRENTFHHTRVGIWSRKYPKLTHIIYKWSLRWPALPREMLRNVDVRALMQNSHMNAVVPSHCGQTAILTLFGTVFERKKNAYLLRHLGIKFKSLDKLTSFHQLGKLERYFEIALKNPTQKSQDD